MKIATFATTFLLMGTFVLSCLAGGDPAAEPKRPDTKKPIYDEKADAKAQIEAALIVANRENRRVLIQWGANWCGRCVLLEERFRTDYGLNQSLLYEYVVVHVDVGNGDKNVDLLRQFKVPFSIPSLTVLDAAGKVLANQLAGSFETKSEEGEQTYDPKKLQKFLTAHQTEPLNANAVLTAALADAAETERGVLLHFGAPRCGWCVKLDAWLEQRRVAEIMSKDFVVVKIDQVRMTEARKVEARYNASVGASLPWFVFLDGKGNVVITSDGPNGNIGFPAEDDGIGYFATMLQRARRRLTTDEIDELRHLLAPPAKKAAASP